MWGFLSWREGGHPSKQAGYVRSPSIQSVPWRLCGNPFCFSDSQALQQSACRCFCSAWMPCPVTPPRRTYLAWETDVHRLFTVGWQRVPFADLVYRAVFQGTSPSSRLSPRRRKSDETKQSQILPYWQPNLELSLFSFFFFYPSWPQRGLAK